MPRFNNWLRLREEISFPDALQVFNYKPGDFIDPQDFKTRFRTLAMQHHPDRGGSHSGMVNISLAVDALKSFIGRQIPGGGPSAAPPPPPRPEPKPSPEPEPNRSPTTNWGHPGLHAANRRDFGKWLHGGIVELLDTVDAHKNSRSHEDLFDAVNHLVELLSRIRSAFVEWQMKTRESTMLHSDDFYELLSRLDTPDESPKGLRTVLKSFKEELATSFYDKYIKDFPPTL
jgi:hypothetical protein